MRHTRFWLSFLLIVLFSIPTLSKAQPLEPQGGTTAPDILVPDVTSYTFQTSKIYYAYTPLCAPILNKTESGLTTTQIVGRTAVQGATPRTMYTYDHDAFCQTDQPDISSNVVSDENYVYWLSREQGGIVRLSENAMVGTGPERIFTTSSMNAELVLIGNNIYLLDKSFSNNQGLVRINKNDGSSSTLLNSSQIGSNRLTFATDGEYLYWRFNPTTSLSTWSLRKYHLATAALSTIASDGVLSYAVQSGVYVYLGYDGRIDRYSHASNTKSPIFIPTDPVLITSLAVDSQNLYFVQYQNCSGCSTSYSLYRRPLAGGVANSIYLPNQYESLHSLTVYDEYLFFIRAGDLVRMPRNADFFTPTNMRITGLEVTQSIQSDAQNIALVRGKRTAVRVYVRSDGADIPNVMAHLYRINAFGTVIGGPLLPQSSNRRTAAMRIPASSSKNNIDQSFNFYLPNDWIDDSTLRVRAILNPYHYPPELNYADNNLSSSTLTMNVSGRLENHFVLFGYQSGGSTFYPRYTEDVLQAYSWIRRAYPVASSPGSSSNPTAGFRPKTRWLFDASLGGNVDGTNRHPECQQRINNGEDIANLCAAWYVVCPKLDTIRSTSGLSNNIFQYGMVADNAGFPRGWACGLNTSGPSGSGTWGWDFDGSYADWYTAHEVGHALGRAHPTPGSAACGHSSSDPAFPWPNAAIGNSTIRGFDMGDRGLNYRLKPAVYSSSTWRDMMSYCANQWISDYTYNGIRSAIPSVVIRPETPTGASYIQLSGVLFAASNEADISQLRKWDVLPFNPPSPDQSGDYRIHVLDNTNTNLASYIFMPEPSEIPDVFSISEWVPFVAGTMRIEIRHATTNTLIWSYDVSSTPPQVSNVVAQTVGNDLNMSWDASDADGDPLSFDILYSVDNGVSWDMIAMGLTDMQAILATDTIAGSQAALVRVIAHDGYHQAEAQSGAVNVPAKAPVITILEPADQYSVAYGSNLEFIAEVFDFQDGTPSMVIWKDQNGVSLANDTSFNTAELPIGINTITIEATNSANLTSSANVTVIIDDELQLPTAQLSASPSQIGWHVADGTTSLQIDIIEINNVTTLEEWTIEIAENAPWLALDVSSNETPATLTLTADPNLIEPGTSVSTMIQITGTIGSVTQIIDIPVTLAKGTVGNPTATTANVYLPLVMR